MVSYVISCEDLCLVTGFILIGFGFSQQQSELILLSWNNSAPFCSRPFYCLIPFILFFCQSFVSLGLGVVSNPVGCYNLPFITRPPRFPRPSSFVSRGSTALWVLNSFLLLSPVSPSGPVWVTNAILNTQKFPSSPLPDVPEGLRFRLRVWLAFLLAWPCKISLEKAQGQLLRQLEYSVYGIISQCMWAGLRESEMCAGCWMATNLSDPETVGLGGGSHSAQKYPDNNNLWNPVVLKGTFRLCPEIFLISRIDQEEGGLFKAKRCHGWIEIRIWVSPSQPGS